MEPACHAIGLDAPDHPLLPAFESEPDGFSFPHALEPGNRWLDPCQANFRLQRRSAAPKQRERGDEPISSRELALIQGPIGNQERRVLGTVHSPSRHLRIDFLGDCKPFGQHRELAHVVDDARRRGDAQRKCQRNDDQEGSRALLLHLGREDLPCQAGDSRRDTRREPQMPARKTRLAPKVKNRALTSLAPRCMNEWMQRVKKNSQARTTDSRVTEPLA